MFCHVFEFACGGLSQVFGLLNLPVWLYIPVFLSGFAFSIRLYVFIGQ